MKCPTSVTIQLEFRNAAMQPDLSRNLGLVCSLRPILIPRAEHLEALRLDTW